MRILLSFIIRLCLKIIKIIDNIVSNWFTRILFYSYNIKYSSFVTNGSPIIRINGNGSMSIGSSFLMNNGTLYNQIGRQQRCMFIIAGKLTIGNNVKMSSTATVCQKSITIGNNVSIGGNCVIYDTDFHSMDAVKRCATPEDFSDAKKEAIIIEDNVFIGAHCTLLKGSLIGKNSIVGACSVVTGTIPPNEIWAGNPARFIKKISSL